MPFERKILITFIAISLGILILGGVTYYDAQKDIYYQEQISGAYSLMYSSGQPREDALRNIAELKAVAARSNYLFSLTFYCLLGLGIAFIAFSFYTVNGINRQLAERVEQKTREVIEKERRYHLVLDNLLEGAQIIDPAWKYVYVNKTVLTQSRATEDQLLDHTMMERFPGIENTTLFTALEKSMQDRIPAYTENEFDYGDGSKGYYELSIQPVPEGLFILSMDISERKKREKQREQYILELQEILFKISHEVRHPVANMLGATTLLKTGNLSSEDRLALLTGMNQSAVVLDDYVRQLSAFVDALKNRDA